MIHYNQEDQLDQAAHLDADGDLLSSAVYKYDALSHRFASEIYDAATDQTTITRYAYQGDEVLCNR